MSTTFIRMNTTVLFAILMLFSSLAIGEDDPNVGFDPFGSSGAETTPFSMDDTKQYPVIPEIQLSNNEISMAFQIISDVTGWSIFPSSEVTRAKVSLWAKDITAKEMLETVVKLAGFIYHKQGDIITVMTYDEYMQHYGLAKKIIPLKHADASSIASVIKPFLTKLGKCVVHIETGTIVLYESNANLKFIVGAIEKLDTPGQDIIVEVINLKYADCESLAKMLQEVFASRRKNKKNKNFTSSNKEAKANESTTVEGILMPQHQMEIYPVSHANQLVIVGVKASVNKVKDLIAIIDIYGDNMALEVIDLKYADAKALAETFQTLFSNKERPDNAPQKNKTGQISKQKIENAKTKKGDLLLSPQAHIVVHYLGRSNQLIIKAYRGDMESLKKLVEKLDIYIEPTTKNYHFIYVEASEIHKGLERILGVYGRDDRRLDGSGRNNNSSNGGVTLVKKTNSILLTGPPSIHRIMASVVESIDVPGKYVTGVIRVYKIENADVVEVAKTIEELIQKDDKQEDELGELEFGESLDESQKPADDTANTEKFTHRIEPKVSVNKATNSIVIQATARQHRELEKLIKELDIRRKQVLIEAMIVEVTTTDDLSLGIELSHAAGDFISFTFFGLSTNLDPTTGVRDIVVSPGGTAAVLSPDKIQAVIQALKSDDNIRITSAPQLLVNDNAVGYINSIAEEPYTQINQGETTTTTSFGGFVEAGTQFAVTPHISEEDYLKIEYQITLNSFVAQQSLPSVPPPRNTTSIQSEATVPNGYTIVVGGLQTTDESETIDKVPFLSDIPILGGAFKNTTIEKRYKTTYLFLTPKIMESTNFSDLKQISDKALKQAEVNKTKKKEEDADIIMTEE
ncbi:secretin N-terminal domain-containing protein [Planctomycetota bacterium]